MVVVPLHYYFVMVVVVVMGLRLRGTMHIDMIMIALDDDLLLIVVMMMVRLWRPVDVDVLVAALHNYFVVVMPVMRGRSVHADVIVVALDDDLVVMIVRRAAFQSPEADIGIFIGIVDTDMNVRGGNHYPSVRRAPSEARGKDRPVHIDVVVVTLNYNLVMVVVVSPALSAFRTGLIANADRTELEEWVQGIPGVGSLGQIHQYCRKQTRRHVPEPCPCPTERPDCAHSHSSQSPWGSYLSTLLGEEGW